MIRGTTAQFKFKLPYAKEDLEWVTIKFWQENPVIEFVPITKELHHCSTPFNTKELCVALTSEETLRFSDQYKVRTQLKGMHVDGTIFASRQHLIPVYPIEDELSGDDNPSGGGDIIVPPGGGDDIIVTPDADGFIILDGDTIVK